MPFGPLCRWHPPFRADVAGIAQAAGASANGVLGQLAFAYDINHISATDLGRIIPIVALLIALLLALVVRSFVGSAGSSGTACPRAA